VELGRTLGLQPARLTSESDKMVRVIELATGLSFAPAERLRMLWGQPHLQLQGTGTTYRLTLDCAERQRRHLRRVYELATSTGSQFVVFPEFSMPLDMVAETDLAISAPGWPRNSIFAVGLAPASVDEFRSLATHENVIAATPIPEGSPAEFVNSCCIWLTRSDGSVSKVLQAKLKPSRPEQATQGMYEGDIVYLLRSDLLNFVFLICFDCIGIRLTELVSALTHEVRDGDSKNLQLLTVLEHNPRPEHGDFLGFAEHLIVPGTSKLNTGLNTAVAFVNSAHAKSGRTVTADFGRSAICYLRRPNWNAPGATGPLNVIPSTFALENTGNTLVRIRFREDGPALHTFTYFIPSLLGPGAGETKYPIQEAHYCKLEPDGAVSGGRPIAALKKVVADWLGTAPQSGDARFEGSNKEVTRELRSSFTQFTELVAGCGGDRLEAAITLLLSSYVDAARPGKYNPDWWQSSPDNWVIDSHGQGILELASVCALLGLLSTVELQACDPSHTCKLGQLLVTVLDGNNIKSCFHMRDVYLRWLKRMAWGETIGAKTLVVLARTSHMRPHLKAIPMDLTFATPDSTELESLPAALRPSQQSIMNSDASVFWISVNTLRDALTQNTVEAVQSQLRGALEFN
jgi:hypothetical protein